MKTNTDYAVSFDPSDKEAIGGGATACAQSPHRPHAVAASDDARSTAGPAPGAAPGIAGQAANDNGDAGPLPPTGMLSRVKGRKGVPSVWDHDDPYVRELKAELLAARDGSSNIRDRRVLAALLAIIDGDGELPSHGGKVAQREFCRAHGISMHTWFTGTTTRALLDRFTPRFRLAKSEPRGVTRGERPAVNYSGLMRDAIVSWARDGVAIPTNHRGQICGRGVAHLLGVDHFKMRNQSKPMDLLRDAVREGIVSLGQPIELPPEMTDTEVEARLAELNAVVDGFDVPGGKVPEAPARRGSVGWEYIASLTGRTFPTMEHHAGYRRRVREVVERRGLMPPGMALHDDTLSAFMHWGLRLIAAENVHKSSCAAIVANHKAALNRFAAVLEIGLEDEVAPIFAVEQFDGNLAIALAQFDNPRSAANHKRMVERWRGLHAAKVGAAELPDDVNDALDAVIRSRGLTISSFAHEMGVAKHVVQQIVSATRGISTGDIDLLRRAEVKLGLPTGTLLTKVSHVTARHNRMAGASEAYRALSSRYRSLLPDEAALWPEQRLANAVEQVKPLVSNGTEYARRCSVARSPELRMPQFDPCQRLREEIDAYRDYKCAPVSYPYIRPNGARWKEGKSAGMRIRDLETVFRTMAAPTGDGPTAGLGAPKEAGTLAWLAYAPFAMMTVAQRAGRFSYGTGEAAERGRVYTSSERDLLAQLVSMTNPVTGWFAQNPQLAEELVPLNLQVPPQHADMLKLFGRTSEQLLLTEGDVAEARRDWIGYLTRSNQALIQALGYVDDVMEVSRNPMIAIDGYVAADEPMAELMVGILGAERKWASEVTNVISYRTDVRDSVMHRLAATTSLRPGNLAEASFTGDERGEIRKVDGTWMLEINYRKFKNYRSARLFGTRTSRRNYELELNDVAGLYDLLDLYFYDVLPAMRTVDTDAAFMSAHGRPMSTRTWYEIVKDFGIKHLAWNPVLRTGTPGVIKMNPYSFRHIRATDILKNGTSFNRLEEAAFALQTSEAMIQTHYGNLLPKDAVVDANRTFDRALRIAMKRNG